MNLSLEIKNLINKNGVDYLLTPQFVNCLKDLGVSREYPYFTTIFKDIISNYGDKFIETYKTHKLLELKKTFLHCRQRYLYEAIYNSNNTIFTVNSLASAFDVFLPQKDSFELLSNSNKVSSLIKELKNRFEIKEIDIDDSQLLMFYAASIFDFSKEANYKKERSFFNQIKEQLLSLYSGKDWFDLFMNYTPGMGSMPKTSYSIFQWPLSEFEAKFGKMDIIFTEDKTTCRFVNSKGDNTIATIGKYASSYCLPNLFDYKDKLYVFAYHSEVINQQMTYNYEVEILDISEYEGIELLDSYLKERLPIYSEMILYMSNTNLEKRDIAYNNMFYLLNDSFNYIPDILFHCKNNPKEIYDYVEPEWNGEHIKECPQNIKQFISFIINNNEINSREIIKEWSLMDFYKMYNNKMNLAPFKNKKTGKEFKALAFFNKYIEKYIIVGFDKQIGELSSQEIKQQKDSLKVVLMYDGSYKLVSQ